MDWQQIAALAVVGVTAFLLVRSRIRKTRRGSLSACGGCSCGSAREADGLNVRTGTH